MHTEVRKTVIAILGDPLASSHLTTQSSLAMRGWQSEAQQVRPALRTQLGHGAHDISIR